MDEFEKLEAELRQCFESYVSKFRCLSFLDGQWQELEKNEQQELEERQVSFDKYLVTFFPIFFTSYLCDSGKGCSEKDG